MQELEKSLSMIEGNGKNLTLVLLGDFNFPNINWSAPSPSTLCSDGISAYFCDIIDDNFLHQMINVPTRKGNILDLVLVNKPELMLRSNVREGLANSDHDSIEFALKVKIARRKCSPRLVYDYKNADWDGLKEDFRNIPWNCIDLVSDIEVVWSLWKSLFFKAVERNIPSKFLSSKRNVPWFNSDIKKLIHKKQRLWKIAKSSGSPDKWSNYKKLNNEVKDKLRKAYYRYVNNLANSLVANPKKFWTFVKSCTGTSSVPKTIEFNGLKGYSPSSIAHLFNTFFHSVFNKRCDESSVPFYPYCIQIMSLKTWYVQ